jgi:hypothetical protein
VLSTVEDHVWTDRRTIADFLGFTALSCPPVWRTVEQLTTNSGTFRFTMSVLRIVVLEGRYRPSRLEDLAQ